MTYLKFSCSVMIIIGKNIFSTGNMKITITLIKLDKVNCAKLWWALNIINFPQIYLGWVSDLPWRFYGGTTNRQCEYWAICLWKVGRQFCNFSGYDREVGKYHLQLCKLNRSPMDKRLQVRSYILSSFLVAFLIRYFLPRHLYGHPGYPAGVKTRPYMSSIFRCLLIHLIHV